MYERMRATAGLVAVNGERAIDAFTTRRIKGGLVVGSLEIRGPGPLYDERLRREGGRLEGGVANGSVALPVEADLGRVSAGDSVIKFASQ